ncbi:MAG: branched-chain amino acid ABC transporter permease [Burkholderiales bacterium]|jgi:branched-chain amino acid transport system permease protein
MSNLTILFDAPIFALQLLVDGIMVGAIFALIAYGMALVWGVMNLINIAQGELVMLGGYIVYYLAGAGLHPLLGVPIAALVMYVLGWALYRGFLFRIVDKDLFISILATFGLSILIQQLANQLFGANVRTVQSGLGSFFFADGTLVVSQIKLVAFGVALFCGTLLVLFLKRSRMGQAIRATAQNARAAKVLGIDTNRVYATTFAINGALCGAAGGLVAMTWIIHPYLGLTYTIRAFMIAVVAGIGNLAGVIFAGTGLGIAENFAGFVLGAEYQAAFVFSLLVVILVGRSLLLIRQRKYLK